MIPAGEQPTEDDLRGYIPRTQSEPDLAWGDLYPQLCAWMNDRENKRKRKEREENPGRFVPGGGVGQFNIRR
jgi:hypothetical protein